jgi:hypothetical protein
VKALGLRDDRKPELGVGFAAFALALVLLGLNE